MILIEDYKHYPCHLLSKLASNIRSKTAIVKALPSIVTAKLESPLATDIVNNTTTVKAHIVVMVDNIAVIVLEDVITMVLNTQATTDSVVFHTTGNWAMADTVDIMAISY